MRSRIICITTFLNVIITSFSGHALPGSQPSEIGIKQSSAQITHYYNEENLKGKQVIAICNFPEKNIAGIVSQVLVLGAIDADGKVTLVHPSQKAENGLPIA